MSQEITAEILEEKRKAFPNFYFISNEALVKVLESGNDFASLRNFLGQMFAGIADLQTNEAKQVEGIVSPDGIALKLKAPVATEGRDVVDWLKEVYAASKAAVKDELQRAIAERPESVTLDWISGNLPQAVKVANQTEWTRTMETAIKAKTLGDLVAPRKAALEALALLARQEMPAPVRATLESLITLEVHNVSAIEELIGANVDAINSEIWTQHMRYYSDNGVVFVKCGTSFVEYQNEFLGNYRNLAITPQTHRMYSAIEKAKFGKKYTFIAGPAGSGKTETTKDFANGIGIAAYVTNCSDRHSVDDITHVIKGAVTGGFWSIFDEFNRVAVEVLQPVTDFLTQLYQAKESGQTTFGAEQTPIDVHSEIQFTMNPGYEGRLEAPHMMDSIVEYVHVEAPDFTLIEEVTLFHMGLITSSTLAHKLSAAFDQLCEQCSRQDHYDYGMRGRMSVCRVAGNVIRATPTLAEDKVLSYAIHAIVYAQLTKADEAKYAEIMASIIEGWEKPLIDEPLAKAVAEIAQASNGEITEYLADKATLFCATTRARHGLILLGAPDNTGKVLNTATQAFPATGSQPIVVHPLDWDTFDEADFYGKLNEDGKTYTDGSFTKLMREVVSDTANQHWITISGAVDPYKIENMNTVLDDNKCLVLPTSERVPLGANTRIVFQTTSLAQASPAFVSRCGRIFIDA